MTIYQMRLLSELSYEYKTLLGESYDKDKLERAAYYKYTQLPEKEKSINWKFISVIFSAIFLGLIGSFIISLLFFPEGFLSQFAFFNGEGILLLFAKIIVPALLFLIGLKASLQLFYFSMG